MATETRKQYLHDYNDDPEVMIRASDYLRRTA
jgi:hypothetical protein